MMMLTDELLDYLGDWYLSKGITGMMNFHTFVEAYLEQSERLMGRLSAKVG